MTSKAQFMKKKSMNLTASRLKFFCSEKDTIKRTKDKHKPGKKYLQTTYLTDDEYQWFKKKNPDNSIRRWATDTKKYLLLKRVQRMIANKHVRRCHSSSY